MTKKNIAVKIDHVSKTFKLPTESSSSLRTTLVNRLKGIKGYTEQHVLKDISFEVEEGDFFGIVGRNGSGKSTLLKIISQINTLKDVGADNKNSPLNELYEDLLSVLRLYPEDEVKKKTQIVVGEIEKIFRNIYPENIMSSAVLLNRGINFYLLVLVSGIITIISHMNSEKIGNKEEK